jgi:hypothetical protein
LYAIRHWHNNYEYRLDDDSEKEGFTKEQVEGARPHLTVEMDGRIYRTAKHAKVYSLFSALLADLAVSFLCSRSESQSPNATISLPTQQENTYERNNEYHP